MPQRIVAREDTGSEAMPQRIMARKGKGIEAQMTTRREQSKLNVFWGRSAILTSVLPATFRAHSGLVARCQGRPRRR